MKQETSSATSMNSDHVYHQIHPKPAQQIPQDVFEKAQQPVSPEQSLMQVLAISGLGNYFPAILGIQEVMQITDESSCKSIGGKVVLFYQRLITLDTSCRDKFDKESERSRSNDLQSFPASAIGYLSKFNTAGVQTSPSEGDGLQIHPLDFFILAYLCGDQSLRDTFIKKIFLCRLAVPVLYPTFEHAEFELLLAPLRSIILEWKAKAGSSETKCYETDAVSAPCHFVLFARISRSERYRKSKIINDILCDNVHPTFCHWDCPNGTRERLLTDGLVEGSWYIPSGKDSDLFSSLIMFLNLRGDLSKHLTHFQMIFGVASVVVQLVSICDLTKKAVLAEISMVLNQGIPVVLLIHDDKSQSTDAFNQYLQQALIELKSDCVNNSISFLTILPTIDNGQLKNAEKIKFDLRQVISQFTKTLPKKSFEFLVDKIKNNDEATTMNNKGKELSVKALRLIEERQGSKPSYLEFHDMKAQLPLQGDLWGNKEPRPVKRYWQTSADAINKMERKMNDLRQERFALCLKPSPLMHSFIEVISNEEPKIETTMNFLRWMRYFLDDNSRKTLTNFHNQHNNLQLKLKSYNGKQDGESKERVKHLQFKIQKAEEELANASFGLEHLMREIGQMYEAVIGGANQNSDSSQYLENVKRLPRRMAALICAGEPVQIMDGMYATEIPLNWIKAVFKELHILLGSTSIFVISVLGFQGSGKSTLLNTMFGLQFAVSAGKCTKGVYMQLVRVNEQSNLPFGYVCVIDTEGLRATGPGMSNYDRDNELATFVIGLANLTIINIKGERYSEMINVLQIVVHAFLRLGLIQQVHQCIFIHQNVGAAIAQEQMQFRSQQLQYILDEMTIEAAEQEGLVGVRTFNDVIEFDCLKDVYLFPDLWHGDPPMAHVNPGYHEQIAALRQNIFLSEKKSQSDKYSFRSFEMISSRISDLRTAILADDFVFTFRNSLEVNVYNTLERKHRALILECDEELLKWKQRTADKLIKNCQDERQIDSCKHDLHQIINIGEAIQIRLEDDLVAYIKDDTHSDLMIKWQDDKVVSLKHDVDSRVTYYKNSISEALDNQRVRLLKNMNNSPFIGELKAEACRFAEKLRSRSKDILPKDLEREFTKLWNGRTANLTSRIPSRITDNYIVEQISHQLYNYFRSHKTMNVTNALKVNPIAKPFGSECNPLIPAVTTKDLTVTSVEDPLFARLIKSHELKNLASYNEAKVIKHAQQLLQEGLKSAYDSLHSLGDSVQFTTKIVTDLLDKVVRTSWEEKSFSFDKFSLITFNASYVPYIAVHVCRYAYPLFCLKQAKYESDEGYVSQLNKYKERLWNLFQNEYDKVNDELICADLVKDHLTERIKSITLDLIPKKIQFEVWQMYETKQCFVREILIDLAKQEHPAESKATQKTLMFEDLYRYIRYPRIFAREWFSRKAKHFITTKNSSGQTKLGAIGAAYIPIMCQDINERLDYMTAAEGEQVPLKTWIQSFCNFKTNNLDVIKTDFNINDSQSSKLVRVIDFNKYIRQKVTTLECNLKQEYLKATPEELGCDLSMYEKAVDQIWGCKENCPLCGEPCFDSSVDHEKTFPHRCMQHRPSGLYSVNYQGSRLSALSNCNFNVASDETIRFKDANETEPYDLYKNYQKYHPYWDIDPHTSSTTSVPFWCWVYATFNDHFAQKYKCVKPIIPSEWHNITQEKAIESLQVAYTNPYI